MLKEENYKNSCVSALKEADYRITAARLAVIECLSTAQGPLSISEIFDELGSESKIDKVSVYRVIEILEELRLVHRASHNGEYLACFHLDCKGSHHVLTSCSECSAVSEVLVPPKMVKALLKHLVDSQQFVPDAHLLKVDGTCSRCQ